MTAGQRHPKLISGAELLEKLVDGLRLDVETGCWVWGKAKDKAGYGYVWNGHRMLRVHRVAYALLVEPIPDGLVIDHLCRNTSCYNPDCLEPVTHRENILRGEGRGAKGARRTHCPDGHPYEGDNLYHAPDGRRHCRTCTRAANKGRRNRRRNPDFVPPGERTQCRRGHPYAGDNLYVSPRGNRLCRTCYREVYRKRAMTP